MAAPSGNLRLYGGAVARVLARARRRSDADLAAVAERPVFVLGSPRSGTTFVAGSIGRVPGFADLGELAPWKAAIPQLASRPQEEVAVELRRTLETVRRYGLVRHLRAVEQSPETAFVLETRALVEVRGGVAPELVKRTLARQKQCLVGDEPIITFFASTTAP